MEYILEETVPSEDLKKFEQKYHQELQHGKVRWKEMHNIDFNLNSILRLAQRPSLSTPGAWLGPGTLQTSGKELYYWRIYSR